MDRILIKIYRNYIENSGNQKIAAEGNVNLLQQANAKKSNLGSNEELNKIYLGCDYGLFGIKTQECPIK
jgi:hypothetical protein